MNERDERDDGLTHVDAEGRTRMVDVSGKPETLRRAAAEGCLVTGAEVLRRVNEGDTPKGNVYETARLAGIQAAKHTWELIPLCHALPLDHVDVRFRADGDRIWIHAEAVTRAATGVEMEALTAVSVAGLTLYDMLKAISKTMRLEGVRLVAKSGGRSGTFAAGDAAFEAGGTEP